MSITPHTRNVTRVFRLATVADLTDGREWYARARRLAEELAASLPADHPHHGDADRAAAVIAVLSPRQSWPQNVKNARLAYEIAAAPRSVAALDLQARIRGGYMPVPGDVGRKVAELLATDTPSDEIVSGPKVTAFWRTIADPSDPRAVVVDRHAIDIALGRPTDDATRGKVLGKVGAYDAVAQTYIRAARILSREVGPITPAEVQAVTWTAWRRTRAAANHGDVVAADVA